MCIGVDGRRIRNNKVAFSNLSGIVWTGPKFYCKHDGQTLQLAVQSKRSLVFKYRYNYNWTVIYLHYLCLV